MKLMKSRWASSSRRGGGAIRPQIISAWTNGQATEEKKEKACGVKAVHLERHPEQKGRILPWRCITMNKAVVDGLDLLALQRGNLMNRDLIAV